jgi:excisionase family DNA binding protein
MNNPPPTIEPTDSTRLALRPREAARALGISDRLLWTWTNQGLIPHTRIGRRVIYPVAQLESWLEKQAQANTR